MPRPLYDYVQHGHAALGHAQANQIFTLRQRLGRLGIDPRERIRAYRSRYFVDVIRLMAFASILDMRCGPQMALAQRRELTQFLALEDSWSALARLGRRAGRELVGRPETLGAEWALLQSLIWRRLLSMSVTDSPRRRLRLDAVPPPDLALRPSRREVPDAEGPRVLWEKVAPLELGFSDEAPRRLNILIPTIDLKHFFGGYIAKLNLARMLARRGARVRLVTVDPVGGLPASWRSQVEAYGGLAGLFQDVEVAFGRESAPLEVSRADGFIASTWWTAHVARAALEELQGGGFVYLIQEYESMTFPMGSYAALADQSYRFPHFAVFSSQFLRDYFRRHEIGVYGPQASGGNSNWLPCSRTPSRPSLRLRSASWRRARVGGSCSTPGRSHTRPGTCLRWACSDSSRPRRRASSGMAGSCGESDRWGPVGRSGWAAEPSFSRCPGWVRPTTPRSWPSTMWAWP